MESKEPKNPFKRIWRKYVKPRSSKPKESEIIAESQHQEVDHETSSKPKQPRAEHTLKQPSFESGVATNNEAQDISKGDEERSIAHVSRTEIPIIASGDPSNPSDDVPTNCTQEVLSQTRSETLITSLVLSNSAPKPSPAPETSDVGPPSTIAQPSIWEKAFSTLDTDLIDSYKSILIADKDIKGDPFRPTTMNSLVQKELAVINKRAWSIKIPFIPHRVLIRTIVDKLVAVLKGVKDFGATAAALDPIHAGLPFAAICMLLPLVTNDSEEQKKALEGIDKTADLIILYSVTEKWCFEPHPNELVKKFAEKLETLYSQISTFLAKAVCHFNRGTLSRIGHSIPKCDDWGGQLQRIQESDQDCLIFIETIRAEDQKSDLVSIIGLLNAQESRLMQFMKDLDLNTKKNEEVIHWVSTAEIETDHQEVREKLGRRYWGSGQWFWPEYSEWSSLKNSVDVLWLCGSVGKGKSSMVSIVIEWHREHLQSQDQALAQVQAVAQVPDEQKIEQRLAFFYCDKGPRGDPVQILRSLVAQLAWAVDGNSISKAVQNEHGVRKEAQRLGAKLTIEECSILLTGLVSNKRVMIVIDSLDQCDDPEKLLLNLRQLANGLNSSVKLFLSSRPEIQVLKVFPRAQKVNLDSSEQATKVDIEDFVRSQVFDRTKLNIGPRLFNGKRRDLEDKLVRVVTNKSQGMFRWAELQLEIFLGPHARLLLSTEIEKKLSDLEAQTGLPQLDDVYEQIFDRNTESGSKSRHIAITSFQILISAQRPLQISELTQAASIKAEGDVDKEVNEQFLLRICSNFIVVGLASVVQFAHASGREYLQARKDGKMSANNCHHEAAETCLQYLCLPSISIRDTKDFSSDFLGYAIVYWTIHWENVKDIASDSLNSLLEQFVGTGGRMSCLAEWTEALPLVAEYLPQGSSPMHEKISDAIASPPNTFWPGCVWGFSVIVRNHAQDSGVDLQLALYVASKYGHSDIVSQLLEEDLDVDAGIKSGLTALHTASEKGHDAVVKLLLQHKASADVEDANGIRPLYMAAVNGEQAVVEALLEKVGDVDAKTDTMMAGGETALLRAAWNGHQGIVELLLKKDANYNAQSPYGETVLYGAACNGHTEVVKSLLRKMKKKKVEVNIQTGSGETALHWAAWNGHSKIVRQLLDDAEVDLANNQGETALYGAAWNGYKEVVEFLLKAGAKDLPTMSGDTAALRARKNRHEDIEKLIEKSRKNRKVVY